MLLNLLAEPDVRGGNEMTALMYACYRGHVALVKLLLRRNANPFLLDEEGDNCLHLACRGGYIEIVKVLHEKQMDLNTRGEHGRTPLMYAAYNGYESVVKFLLNKRALPEIDPSFVENKDNCLHLSCAKGHINVVIILIEEGGMVIEKRGEKMRTPLLYACRHGQLETAKELKKRGANVTVEDEDNFTCLHLAAMKGHIPTVKWLFELQEIKVVNCLNKMGRTPLMFALQFGQVDMVNYLLKEGGDISLKDNDGTSCLHFAAKSDESCLIDICLQKNQDINSVTNIGLTPAMAACRYGNIEQLKYLLKKGADETKGSSGGCLHSAVLGGHLKMLKYLITTFRSLDINKPGKQNQTPLMIACNYGSTDIGRYLVSYGADVECKDQYKLTCLHKACKSGCKDLVEWLLEMGLFDIDCTDGNGLTPLYYAVKSNSPDVIELLVQNGADLTKKDRRGGTYLHKAAWEGKIKSCKKLLELGIQVKECNYYGQTARTTALRNGQNEVVSVLDNYIDSD